MHLERLQLEEFRGYRRAMIELPREGLALYGANASGKSTLLEAIALLSTTRSPRSTADRELINWSSGQELGFPPFARVSGLVHRFDETVQLEIGIALDHAEATSAKKQFKLNGRSVRASALVGQLRSVLFTPEDVSLVSGPPVDRRRYLDQAICQLDAAYMRALSIYGRLLGQRNSLLKQFARDQVSPSASSTAAQLAYWDEQLTEAGSLILLRRAEIMRKLNELACAFFRSLDGGELQLQYRPGFTDDHQPGEMSREGIALALRNALANRRSDEIRRGVTLTGPHRDDFALAVNNRDAAAFASRGQQRLVVLAMKLAEAHLMAVIGGEAPMVMLDDILSELDARHRGLVLETAISMKAQLMITSTDAHLLDSPLVRDLPRWQIVPGQVLPGIQPTS